LFFQFVKSLLLVDSLLQIRQAHVVERKSLSLDVARQIFSHNPYKLSVIDRIGAQSPTVDAYRIGDFVDLCAGPHVPSLRVLSADAFRLHSVSGTHVEHEQRVSGVAFAAPDGLKAWQAARDAAAARDHRRIGTEQELFLFSEYSPGGVMMLPAGQRIRQAIQRELRREYRRRGYEEVSTPQVFDRRLWERSGHWDNYRNDMFEVVAPTHKAAGAGDAAESQMFLKPMNCPSHCVMYGRKVHSHRDLPVRYADFGALHRNELAGALRGLTRLRRFCQDDAHIFCAPTQVADEVAATLDFVASFYAKLGFDTSADALKFALSTRPESSIGDDALWATAESALTEALDRCEQTRGRWSVAAGDGAFYGPKIDVTLRDAAGRWHQCGTVQLDYNLPQRFNLLYQDDQQTERHVVMIHRAVCGSLERMLGVLTEHHAGRWPLWLAPVRAIVIPVAESHRAYAARVAEQWRAADPDAVYEVQVDRTDASLAKRIRNATSARVPYVIVVGDKEVAGELVNVRERGSSESRSMPLVDLIAECQTKADAFQ
jgi:threonyl-tRNA synthetase